MRYFSLVMWVVMILCARCVPHLSNFSPVITLSVLAGVVFNRRVAVAMVVLTLLGSDVLLAYLYGYPVWGGWSVFVYSGMVATVLLGARLQESDRLSRYFLLTLGSSVGFWLWTNLASWWSMYPHNMAGLTQCYIAALPFLQRSLLGAMLVLPLLYVVMRRISLMTRQGYVSITQ